MSISYINNRIWNLWTSYRNLNHISLDRTPLFFHNLKKNCLLFIGLNPSFSPKGSRRIFANTKYESWDLPKFFQWKNMEGEELSSYIKECIDIDGISREKYSYHKIFVAIAKELGREKKFEHIDLFFFREEDQKKAIPLIYPKEKLTPFAKDQLQISLGLIDCINPELILVANALASRIILGQLEKELNWEESLGTYTLLVKGKKVPIFFSGMLGGQRPMDKGSLKRLKWHMKYALEHMKQID